MTTLHLKFKSNGAERNFIVQEISPTGGLNSDLPKVVHIDGQRFDLGKWSFQRDLSPQYHAGHYKPYDFIVVNENLSAEYREANLPAIQAGPAQPESEPLTDFEVFTSILQLCGIRYTLKNTKLRTSLGNLGAPYSTFYVPTMTVSETTGDDNRWFAVFHRDFRSYIASGVSVREDTGGYLGEG